MYSVWGSRVYTSGVHITCVYIGVWEGMCGDYIGVEYIGFVYMGVVQE